MGETFYYDTGRDRSCCMAGYRQLMTSKDTAASAAQAEAVSFLLIPEQEEHSGTAERGQNGTRRFFAVISFRQRPNILRIHPIDRRHELMIGARCHPCMPNNGAFTRHYEVWSCGQCQQILMSQAAKNNQWMWMHWVFILTYSRLIRPAL